MSRYNTDNPIGSADPRDRDDNSKNLDEAVNSESSSFTDRLGKLRPTLKGAIDPTGLASAAASSAQQAASQADRAETARDAATVNAQVYDDIAAGLAATSDGDQFQVASGLEIVRYRRDDSETAMEVARYKSAGFFDGLSRTTDDFQYPVYDREGAVVSYYRADGAFIPSRIAAGEESAIEQVKDEKFFFPFIDDDGLVVAGLKRDGVFAASSLGAGLHQIAPVDHPVFQWLIRDLDGVILCGLTKDGRFLPGGDSSPSDPVETHTVLVAFVEPWIDPSESVMLTWVSTSDDATLAEYRIPGASGWQSVSSQRSRGFPALDGLYIHTAVIKGLNFATTYECRWPGAQLVERFRTSPRSNPKIAAISDFQASGANDTMPMAVLGRDMSDRGADILAIPGDHVDDDGIIAENTSTRWLNYLVMISANFRSGGALIPSFMLIGNHEGRNAEGTANADFGGDGTIGQIDQIMSWSYWDQHPTRYVNSAAYFGVGGDVFVIAIETDHTEQLSPQIPWLADQVSNAYENYSRIVVMGHAPAFYPGPGVRHIRQARTLRNEMYPALEPYSDKILAYICGHSHVLALTPALRVLYDDGLSPEQNDERYTEDGELGIVQIGTGPCQASPRASARGEDTSDFDGTPMFTATMGWDGEALDITGVGITNATEDNINHYWMLDLSGGDFVATAYGTHGQPYLTYSDGE